MDEVKEMLDEACSLAERSKASRPKARPAQSCQNYATSKQQMLQCHTVPASTSPEHKSRRLPLNHRTKARLSMRSPCKVCCTGTLRRSRRSAARLRNKAPVADGVRPCSCNSTRIASLPKWEYPTPTLTPTQRARPETDTRGGVLKASGA